MTQSATLFGVGVGPGDPELITIKAVNLIRQAPYLAYFAKRGHRGHARRIADAYIRSDCTELRLEYPHTTEIDVRDQRYGEVMREFYRDSAHRLSEVLHQGNNVTVICEGDPFFYGSFLPLYDRLRTNFRCQVVPGVSGMSGCWTAALAPMTHGDDVLTVLPGTLDEDALTEGLKSANAAVIMKIGRNFEKIRSAITRAGLSSRALYVERGTMEEQRVEQLVNVTHRPTPYFSIILIPGRQGAR